MSISVEKRIEQAHEEWMAALDVVKDPIFMHDKNFRILRCNRAYQQCAGLPFKKIIGEPYFEIFPKTHAPLRHCTEVLERSAVDGDEEEVEVGNNLYRSRAYAVKDKEGNCLYSVHILEDITNARLAEEALKEAELRFQAIFDGAHDGILLADMSSKKFTVGNARICEMLGYSLEELPFLGVTDIHPEEELPYVLSQFEKQARGEIELASDLPVKRKDGTLFFADVNSFPLVITGKEYLVGFFRDITERKRAEAMVQESEERYRAIFEGVLDGIVLAEVETKRVIDGNSAICRMLGYKPEELAGLSISDLHPEEDWPYVFGQFSKQSSGEIQLATDMPIKRKDGSVFYADINTANLNVGNRHYIAGVFRDITERRQSEESLKLFRTLLDNSSDGIDILDPATLNFLDINETECRNLGYSREELLSMHISEIDMGFGEALERTIQEQMALSGTARFESTHRRKDGSTFPVEVNTKLVELDKPYIMSIARDISERKVTEEALRASEEKFRSITVSAQDAIIMMDNEGKISFWNEAAEIMFGYPAQKVMGEPLHTLIAPERFMEAHRAGFEQFKKTGEGAAVGKTVELFALRKNGEEFPVELSLSVVERNNCWHAIGIIRDITERKQAEAALQRANRALRTLSAGNLALVRAESEDALLTEVTSVIVDKGGYSLAAVYYAEDNPQKSLIPKACSGRKKDNFCEGNPRWSENEKSELPVTRAIESGATQICRDIAAETGLKLWRDAVLSHGYLSNIALPLSGGGRVFGALSIYSSELEPFDDEEVQLLEELANDLAYGIGTLRTRAEHEQHAVLLQQSLEQSILTIAATVEARDPYTAGHQRRVGELATAIAKEMELPEMQVQGIHFAAIIHDLGKIHVPAEILSKPGRLNDLEYRLIQMHSQAGYDILKDVSFPWPIAEIILQHHEKLDGSGYPQGLKDGEIRLEAKIICVADVVEAISSHRPYRPALGTEPALEEIRQGKGSLYDPAVVDACLSLFTEKDFAFNSEFS
ncbi:MAG: PAS domain S-box protein [Helicobacteraceae bacterium]|nr:PAS domain S-box protein [Helicobacteraceae bacterium]